MVSQKQKKKRRPIAANAANKKRLAEQRLGRTAEVVEVALITLPSETKERTKECYECHLAQLSDCICQQFVKWPTDDDVKCSCEICGNGTYSTRSPIKARLPHLAMHSPRFDSDDDDDDNNTAVDETKIQHCSPIKLVYHGIRHAPSTSNNRTTIKKTVVSIKLGVTKFGSINPFNKSSFSSVVIMTNMFVCVRAQRTMPFKWKTIIFSNVFCDKNSDFSKPYHYVDVTGSNCKHCGHEIYSFKEQGHFFWGRGFIPPNPLDTYWSSTVNII